MTSEQPRLALRDAIKVERYEAAEHIMLQTPNGAVHSPFCVASVCPGATVDEFVTWAIGGERVTDPARIAELERTYKEQCRT